MRLRLIIFTALMIVATLAAVASISNAQGSRLQFSDTQLPSGNHETQNALGESLTISSSPVAPVPQQNASGARLLPVFPFISDQGENLSVTNQWVIR